MNTEKRQELAGRIGGVIGFVLYLVVGLIPCLIFGKHGGALLAKAILGVAGADSVTGKMLVGGGMVLGFAVGLFCFVLLGAVVAQGISNLIYYGKSIDAELAANNGQLHSLPPHASSANNSAPSTPQDHKS